MAVKSKKKMMVILIIAVIALCACGSQDEPSLVSHRRGYPEDIALEEYAKDAIAAFKKDYPDMKITLFHWRKSLNGDETYVIEGIENLNKSAVHYMAENMAVIGRVERALEKDEIHNGKGILKPLDYDILLTYTEIRDIAEKKLDGDLKELKVYWTGETPEAYVQVIKKEKVFDNVIINAVNGEIIY